jgi:hypothetical protein
MPAVTEQELQELVDAGRISGITLDTTEFHHFNYHFESKGLAALGQFNGTDISVLFSEVIINEVQGHLRDQLTETAEKARSGINQFLKEWRSQHELADVIAHVGIGADASARAKELTDDFVQKIGAEIVPVDNGSVQIRELHDRYFSAQAPFSQSAEKKNEFPDAMALLSLQGWAQQQQGMLLAVSSDGDWARFAEGSPHLVVVPKIGPALNVFNRHDGVFAARLLANLRGHAAQSLHAAVNRELERFIEEWQVEAHSDFYLDSESGFSAIDSWEVKPGTAFNVLASDDESLTVSFDVSVWAEFEAYFTLSVRDSIDRDYVQIDRSTASRLEQFDVTIEATVAREDGDDPEALDVEAEKWNLTVDFGYIEPDY